MQALAGSADGGLEQLDDVPGGVLEQNLLSAGSFDDVIAELDGRIRAAPTLALDGDCGLAPGTVQLGREPLPWI